MIYVDFEDSFIDSPEKYEELKKDVKLYLREYLDKGMLIFKIPDRLSELTKEEKKAYKVGWLHEMMLKVYPEYTKTYIAERLSEVFHLWISYRQFSNLLNLYELKRKEFII